MKSLRAIFLRGLLTLLPIAVTIYVLYTGVLIFENLLGNVLRSFIPATDYVPGYGFSLTIILIFVFGLLLNNMITATFWSHIEKKLISVPFIKAIYSPLRDLMNLFSIKGQKNLQGVVLVDFKNGIKILGLVTRDHFPDLGAASVKIEDRVAVYLPMSYGLGGFTLLVPKSQIEIVDIPVEKALQLAITGWVGTQTEGLEKNA